jgi:L-seryl-tRNA(Ser) seleniumtransferase
MHPAQIPSIHRLLESEAGAELISRYGRSSVTTVLRETVDSVRAAGLREVPSRDSFEASVFERVRVGLAQAAAPTLRPVFNLTGTVLHTNLGRAGLPREAVEAVACVAAGPSNLEYDLGAGHRGERDVHVERQLCALTGAEAATVVNNNAAAVMLVLNTLASDREVPTSRGELVEIGGSFRLPEIMQSSGCRLREVGTTNRTHLRDYAAAIDAGTGVVMKVHTSNYEVVGFTATVETQELAPLCRERGVPLVVDLGSGSLVDLRRYELPAEPTPMQALAQGADVVTFSGDKLLGGPQAGLIVGRADLVARIRSNPVKRALRVDKMTIAALSAVLRLYEDPDRLPERLPTLRLLTRPFDEIRALARRLHPAVTAALDGLAAVHVCECESEVGSGALPTRTLRSFGIRITPLGSTSVGRALERIAAAFRSLPVPVIGRVHEGAFLLDLRCLEEEGVFLAQLPGLRGLREAAA